MMTAVTVGESISFDKVAAIQNPAAKPIGHRNQGPYLAPHTRKLTLPANPNSVASNGYTNLENWLHSMNATVQGTTSAQSAAAPPMLSVN